MTTQTITIPQFPHLILKLRPAIRFTINSVLDQLADISVNHIQANDPLSNKIHQWCYETLDIDLDDEDDEAALQILGDQVLKLMTSILINPITKTPYKNPVWVNGWVLEKSMLDYLGNFGENPITNSDDYAPHLLAKQMIDWVESLVQATLIQDPKQTPEDQLEMVLFSSQPNLAMDSTIRNQSLSGSSLAAVQIFYRTMVVKAMESQRLEQKNAEINQEIVRYQELTSILRESIARAVEAAKIALQGHEAYMDQRIANVEATHEREFAALVTHLKEQEKRYEAIKATDEKIFQLTMVRLDQAIERNVRLEDNLTKKIQLTQEQQSTIATLQNNVANLQQALSKVKPPKSKCSIQ